MALQSPGRYSSIGSPSRPVAAARIAWPAWVEVAAVVLVAGLLRLVPWLADYPLHRDEALYGYWARLIASGQDPLLLTPWIDKPPLSIYLIAGSFAGLGVSELTLRLPGLVASMLTVPAVYALANRMYGRPTARLAAGLFALSPFAVLFAPTAFTDTWLTLWLVVGAWAALSGRGLATGLAAGLAVASKQQGALVAPLLLVLLMVSTWPSGERGHNRLRSALAALVGFAAVFGPLTFWDSLRWHNRPSFWDRSLTTYGPLVAAPPTLWPSRAADWAEPLGYLFGFPVLSWAMLALAAWTGIRAQSLARQAWASRIAHLGLSLPGRAKELPLSRSAAQQPRQTLSPKDTRPASPTEPILAGYVAGYLLLHLIVTFQPWDRYLLPLVPLVCLLAARGAQLAGLVKPDGGAPSAMAPLRPVIALALAAGLVGAAGLGAVGRFPVGSDHGAYTGIRQVAAFLRYQPAETVIYHQSLGWYFDFYLFDAPQERRWFDTAEKLAAEAGRTAEAGPHVPQWAVVPGWEADRVADWAQALAARGLTLADARYVHRPDGSISFEIYRIVSAGDGK